MAKQTTHGSGRQVVVRRYRPGKDGTWFSQLPDADNPARRPTGADVSSWVGEVDGSAVAVCTWRWLEPLEDASARIERLWVDEPHRRQAVATRVYRRALNEIRKQFRKAGLRLRRLTVNADPTDPAAAGFLRAMKFEVREDGTAVRTLDEPGDD